MNKVKKYLILAKNILAGRLFIAIIFLIIAGLVLISSPALADIENSGNISLDYQLVPENQVNNLIQMLNPEVIDNGGIQRKDSHLPENKGLIAKYSINAVITAYNSDIGQTDETPCITANGFNLCMHGQEDTVAINGVKMGTKVRFPGLFGNKVFVVRDRMNARYNSSRVDVWMLSRADAKNFGVKMTRMEVLE
jgi:3D (Asp-Asp-Asp) domain-containing protein